MTNSRKIEDLLPHVQELAKKFIDACHKQGIDLLVTSTYRDKDCQAALYAQGRTSPGKIVTNARAGQSMHNWRVAFDIVPLRNGKPVWSTSGADHSLWETVGHIGQSVGLEWGGNWKSLPDFPHFQATGGLTLADFNAGKTPKYA